MNLFESLERESRARALRLLIIGGHALNAYGYTRVTQDLDILIDREERVHWLTALESLGFRLHYDGGVFLQTMPPAGCRWPLDLMLVSSQTFSTMYESSRETEMGECRLRVPSLEHLIALKLHVLKQGLSHRGFKDFMDVLSLIQANDLDVGSDSFKALCKKYGNAGVYERIVAFKS